MPQTPSCSFGTMAQCENTGRTEKSPHTGGFFSRKCEMIEIALRPTMRNGLKSKIVYHACQGEDSQTREFQILARFMAILTGS